MKIYKLLDQEQTQILEEKGYISLYRPLLNGGKAESGIFEIIQELDKLYKDNDSNLELVNDIEPSELLLTKIAKWFIWLINNIDEPREEYKYIPPSNLEIILSLIMQMYCSCFTRVDLNDWHLRRLYIDDNSFLVGNKYSYVELDADKYGLYDGTPLYISEVNGEKVYTTKKLKEYTDSYFHIHEIKYVEKNKRNDAIIRYFNNDRKSSNFVKVLDNCFQNENEERLFIMNSDFLPYSFKTSIKLDCSKVRSVEEYLYYYFLGVLDIVHNTTPQYVYLKLEGLKPVRFR